MLPAFLALACLIISHVLLYYLLAPPCSLLLHKLQLAPAMLKHNFSALWAVFGFNPRVECIVLPDGCRYSHAAERGSAELFGSETNYSAALSSLQVNKHVEVTMLRTAE